MKYYTTKEMALRWNISERRIRTLCAENRIKDAFMVANTWAIPETAEKPNDLRTKQLLTVVVFGGATGVGKEICERFLKMHTNVVCLDKIANSNPNIKSITIKYNLNSIASSCNAIKDIDILIIYPSIYISENITKTSYQNLTRTIELNVKASFFVMKSLINKLRISHGQIIIMSSSAGEKPEAMSPAYCMSQAALIMLGKNMAISEGKNKIRVNTILMGPAVDSSTFTNAINETEINEWKKLNPLQSMCEINDFVDAAVYLSGINGSKVNNITGAILAVDCGETITGELFNKGGTDE